MLAMELLAVGLFTLLAGASPEAGTIMVIIMVTFWVIFMVTDAGVIGHIGAVVSNLSQNPGNKTGVNTTYSVSG
jgi:hypothetical protein